MTLISPKLRRVWRIGFALLTLLACTFFVLNGFYGFDYYGHRFFAVFRHGRLSWSWFQIPLADAGNDVKFGWQVFRGHFEWWHFSRPPLQISTNAAVLQTKITIALWPAVFLLLAAHVLWFWRVRRNRPRPGLCPHCNYNLRGSPDRCPECGYTADSAHARIDSSLTSIL